VLAVTVLLAPGLRGDPRAGDTSRDVSAADTAEGNVRPETAEIGHHENPKSESSLVSGELR
jgi:hypothetical protein